MRGRWTSTLLREEELQSGIEGEAEQKLLESQQQPLPTAVDTITLNTQDVNMSAIASGSVFNVIDIYPLDLVHWILQFS